MIPFTRTDTMPGTGVSTKVTPELLGGPVAQDATPKPMNSGPKAADEKPLS